MLYQFFWNEYCDRFLEAVKGDLRDGADASARAATLTVMDTVLRHYLALLHPVMPHITEELWSSLGFADGNGGLPLMLTPLPSPDGLLAGVDEERITLACAQAAALYETANKARNLKAEYDLSKTKRQLRPENGQRRSSGHPFPSLHPGERQIRHPGRFLRRPEGNSCGSHASRRALPAAGRPH